jgi:phospholipase/lecithinase/hemolysin
MMSVWICLLTFALLSITAEAEHGRYEDFFVFGDSLADNGNDLLVTRLMGAQPAIPPSVSPHRTYFDGRFSNGYVAFEYLWQMLGGGAPGTREGLTPFLASPLARPEGAVDFAFGGTGTPLLDRTPGGLFVPGLKGQVELFRAALRGRKAPKEALYAIVTGANDYGENPFNVPMEVAEVVGNIGDVVESLYEMGARDVLVVDLPDLGLLPGASVDPAQAMQQSELTRQHNAALSQELTRLERRLKKLRVFRAHIEDAYALLPSGMNRTTPAVDALFAFAGHPPQDFPFPMSACLFVDPGSCLDVPASPAAPVVFNADLNFLFWDIVHPTTEGHRALAQYLFNVLSDDR